MDDMDVLLSRLGLEVGIEVSDKLKIEPKETLEVSDAGDRLGSTHFGHVKDLKADVPANS
jgi:hypothetical protein